LQFPKFLQSAFDRLGNDQESMKAVAANTATTAASVSVGGALYERVDKLVTAIESLKGGMGGKANFTEALALRIVTPALKPIGLGLGFIVDALERAPEGKVLKEKMDAIVGGLTKLGDVAKSILSFAGYIILAIPLLMVAAATIPIWAPLLFLVVKTLMFVTKSLDKKALESLNNLGEVGLNLLALAGSLAIIGLIAVTALKGTLAAGLIVLAIGGVFMLLEEMGISETLKTVGTNLATAGLGILGLVVSLALAGLIISAVGAEPMFKVLAVVGAVGLTFFIVGLFSNQIEKGAKALMFAAGSVIILGLTLLFMKFVMSQLGGSGVEGGPMSLIDALPSLGIVLGMGIIFGILGFAAENIVKGAGALIVGAISLIVLSFGLDMISASVPDLDTSLAILGIVGGLGIVFGLAGIGPVPMAIALGAAAMAAVGVSLMVIAAGLAIIGPVVKGMKMEEAEQIAIIIGGLALGFAAAGLAGPLILLGSAAMLVAGVATITIAAALAVLGLLDFSSLGTLNEKSSKPFGFSGEVSEGFLGFGKGRKKTNFEVATEAIAAGVALGPLQILGVMTGAPVLLLASAAIIGIATGLRLFKGILGEVNLSDLKSNMETIVDALAGVFAGVHEKYPGEAGEEGFLAALTGKGKRGKSPVALGISAVAGMGKALTGIAKGTQAMANLKFPTGFDKDGKPTGYETINLTKAIPQLTLNVKDIVTGLSGAFAEVGAANGGGGWFSSSNYEKGVKVVQEMGTPLYNLANGVQNMANLKFPSGYDKDGKPTGYKSIGNVGKLVKDLTKNTKAIIKGLASVFEDIGKGDAADTSWFSKNSFEKGIQVTEMLASPYASLAQTVDDVVSITGKVTDADGVRKKISAIVEAITLSGDNDISLVDAKSDFVEVLGDAYAKMGKAIPKIIDSIAKFTVDKAKSFASIFGGESPAEAFPLKEKFMRALTASYLRMAVAIPLIVGSINTVQAEQLDAFSSIYGGSLSNLEESAVTTRSTLFDSVGNAYQKLGSASGQITQAINSVDENKLIEYKGLFVGRVSGLRPVAGYEAQTELWNAIGENSGKTSSSMPGITAAVNSMDITKLIESRKMFEALGVLANGGSAGDILERMGESLEEAMERLADILMEFQTSVGDAQNTQGGILSEIASIPGKLVGGVVNGVTGGNSSKDTGKITKAINDLRRALQDTGIKVKELPAVSPLDRLNQ
jgi:hypothetical protein